MAGQGVMQRRFGSIAGRGGGPNILGAIWRDSFFQYASNALTFAAGTENFQQTIQIQTDAHFLCVMTMYDNTLIVPGTGALTGAGFPVCINGGAVIQLTDASAQRALQSAQVPINTIFGTAQRPYVWPFTHAFRAGGGISFSITGAGATVAGQVIRLVFAGFKIPVGKVLELDNPAEYARQVAMAEQAAAKGA
jgi:hypothetical protein